MKNRMTNYKLYCETLKNFAEKGTSEKEIFTLLLSLCANYLSQILDILEEDERKNDKKTTV